MNEKLHRVIGIDLGTTYSAVATYNTYSEQAEIIKDRTDADAPTTPSVISLDPMLRKAIVGRVAKQNLPHDPQNTIIEIKREMGELFRPETLDKFGARGLFNERDPVKAHFAGQWLLPQEISAFTLMKMKEIAEQEVGEEIRDAVITVPAYFTEKQKKATKEAALLAGLYPRQLIPEPTAAAICYGVDRMEAERKVYLVFDLGGGTFDVSIIEVEGERINVIATSGDPRLGGGDFDDAITKWTIEQLQEQYGIDVRTNSAAKAKIKLLAEQAKIRLSTFPETTLALIDLDPQKAPSLTLTRDKFLESIDPLLTKSLNYVDKAIASAEAKKGVRREDINAILLVGGSSKIPKVKSLLLDYFGKDENFLRSELNPDEVVARGAAIMAWRFRPSPPPFDVRKKEDSALVNVDAGDELKVGLITEHSLGIATEGNIFSKIVDQGSNIPIEITKKEYTNSGPSEYTPVEIYQGEGEHIFENTLIGTLALGPMEPKPRGSHQFAVTFKLDVNGLLSTTVHHVNEGKTYQGKFENITGVGGDDKLAPMRNKLLQFYAQKSSSVSSAGMPPPPPVSQSVKPSQPEVPTETATSSHASSATTTGPEKTTRAQEEPQPKEPTAAGSDLSTVAGIIEPTIEVPEQFKAIVRRAKKQLVKEINAELLKAYNDFATALNSGKSIKDLEPIGDDLADAYDDARR